MLEPIPTGNPKEPQVLQATNIQETPTNNNKFCKTSLKQTQKKRETPCLPGVHGRQQPKRFLPLLRHLAGGDGAAEACREKIKRFTNPREIEYLFAFVFCIYKIFYVYGRSWGRLSLYMYIYIYRGRERERERERESNVLY